MEHAPDRTKLLRVLLAECDHEVRSSLKHLLERGPYTVEECSSRCELQYVLESFGAADIWKEFDLLIFDKRLLDNSTVNMIHSLQQCQRYPPLVLIDGWPDDCRVRVSGLSVAAVIDTPTATAKYMARIRKIAPHRRTES